MAITLGSAQIDDLTKGLSDFVISEKSNRDYDPNVQVIYLGDKPLEGETKWRFPMLFKQKLTGALMVWQVGFDGHDRLEMIYGEYTGVKQIVTTKVETNLSGRTLIEQVYLEAKSRYEEKYRDGYRLPGSELPHDPEPMLSYTWVHSRVYARLKTELDAEKARIKSEDPYDERLKKLKIDPKLRRLDRFPVAVQVKIDGFRQLIKLTQDGEVVCRSRAGRINPGLNHIKKDLKNFFMYLPQGVHLDTEIYNFNMNWQELSSAFKTEKTLHPRHHELVCYIFDIITPELMPYEKRHELLANAACRYVSSGFQLKTFAILPYEIANTEDEILTIHQKCRSSIPRYEGLMIKKMKNKLEDCRYKSKRNANTLKYKEYMDDVATVIGVVESSGTQEGTALLTIRDSKKIETNIVMRASFDERREWFQNPKKVIGRKILFQYKERSIYKIPREPTGIRFLDDDDEAL